MVPHDPTNPSAMPGTSAAGPEPALPPGAEQGAPYYPPAYYGPAGYPGVPMNGAYGGPNMAGTTPPNALDPVSILMGLRRRWFRALLLGSVLAAAAALTTWKVWPPDNFFVAGAVHVNPVRQSVLTTTQMGGPKSQAEINSFLQSQQALARSRTVLMAAVNQPQVRQLSLIKEMMAANIEPVDWLYTKLSIQYAAPQVLVIGISYDKEPEQLQTIVNAVIHSYLDRIIHRDDDGLLTMFNRLQKSMDYYQGKLQDKQDERTNISKALGAHDDTSTKALQKMAIEQLGKVTTRWTNATLEIKDLERKLTNARRKRKAIEQQVISDADVENWVAQDTQVQEYQATIDELQGRMAKYETLLAGGKNNPIYKEAEGALRVELSKLQARKRKLRPQAEDDIRDNLKAKQDLDIGLLQGDLTSAEELEKDLRQTVEELTKKSNSVNDDSIDLEAATAQVKALNEKIGKIQADMDDLEMEMSGASPVAPLDEAWITAPTIGRKQVMATWGAGLGAFGLVLFVMSWREYSARKINTLDEIVHGLGLRVVGTLPAVPDRRGRHEPYGASHENEFWPSYLIESVDTTRTMLLHAARVESIRSVLIASAQSGEGKTSLAIQLAASLARAGRKTLFIDGDLRNPAVHQVFNQPRGPGFSELLRGEVQIPAALRPTAVRGLWLLPAGVWNAQATEALAQEAARPILQRLKNEFDFIVIDSSPALAVVDALLLGQQADAAILSIMHGVSHSPSVYTAHQRFDTLGVRILGAVVNGVAGNRREYALSFSAREALEPAADGAPNGEEADPAAEEMMVE